MKFIVDIEDFWLDEEELTDALESRIKNSVVTDISKSIKDKVETQITKRVNEVIDKKLDLIIDNTLTDLLATGIIRVNRNEISIRDHIRRVFENSVGWNNPKDQITKIAKAFGAELKVQYNAVFANKIVEGLKEQGFLKDELVQVLLGNDKQN